MPGGERGLDYRIQVDGGINFQTAAECARAGADVFESDHFVWPAQSQSRVARMRKAVNSVGPRPPRGAPVRQG